MILAEKEAGTKWCPASRIADGVNDNVYNRWVDRRGNLGLVQASKCIGSECMMWRWAKEQPGGDKVGYCGLVNK